MHLLQRLRKRRPVEEQRAGAIGSHSPVRVPDDPISTERFHLLHTMSPHASHEGSCIHDRSANPVTSSAAAAELNEQTNCEMNKLK